MEISMNFQLISNKYELFLGGSLLRLELSNNQKIRVPHFLIKLNENIQPLTMLLLLRKSF